MGIPLGKVIKMVKIQKNLVKIVKMIHSYLIKRLITINTLQIIGKRRS